MRHEALAGLVRISPRVIATDAEFAHMHAMRLAGFTPWYVDATPRPSSLREGRVTMNALAHAFPEFFHQARLVDNRAIGYFATIPGSWSGAAQALRDLDFYRRGFLTRCEILELGMAWRCAQALPARHAAFDWLAAKLRAKRLASANSIVLVAMTIDPQFQGLRLPTLFFDAVKRAARSLGLCHVIGPFRPVSYGLYKAQRRAPHSSELFSEYCALRDVHGWPVDPWWRTVARNGAEFLRPEPRSLTVEHPLDTFERLRHTFQPERWYSPQPDVWECGETPTWYVDRARGLVASVEPNLWVRLCLEAQAA